MKLILLFIEQKNKLSSKSIWSQDLMQEKIYRLLFKTNITTFY